MLVILAQATPPPEPSPHGWAQTGEKLVGLAAAQPDAFWPIVAVSLPLLTVAGMVLLVVKWLLPAWREEKKADRDALVTALKQRGEEAERDAAKDRELAKTQSEALVGRIETKIDGIRSEVAKIDGRVERHSEVLARLAAKVGAGLALLASFLGGAAAGAGWLALLDRPVAVTTAPSTTAAVSTTAALSTTPTSCSTAQSDDTAVHDCPKGCPIDSVCCGQEKCCPKKRSTAQAPKSPPLSSLELASLASFAAVPCLSALDACVVAD